MNLYQLQQFQAVAELEHVTKAAHRLHLSQPMLSRTVQTLEREFNVSLFERKNRTVALNDNGYILLGYAQHISALVETMTREIAEMSSHQRKTISILLRSNQPVFTKVIFDFSKLYPETHFHIASYVENARIVNEQFDFELGCNLEPDETYDLISFGQGCLSIAVSDLHPLTQESHIDLDGLNEKVFLALSLDSRGRNNTNSLDSYLRKLQFSPKLISTCTDSQSMYSLIRENLGIGLSCPHLCDETQTGISFIPIQGESFFVTTDLLWKKHRPLSPICRLFREYVMLQENDGQDIF